MRDIMEGVRGNGDQFTFAEENAPKNHIDADFMGLEYDRLLTDGDQGQVYERLPAIPLTQARQDEVKKVEYIHLRNHARAKSYSHLLVLFEAQAASMVALAELTAQLITTQSKGLRNGKVIGIDWFIGVKDIVTILMNQIGMVSKPSIIGSARKQLQELTVKSGWMSGNVLKLKHEADGAHMIKFEPEKTIQRRYPHLDRDCPKRWYTSRDNAASRNSVLHFSPEAYKRQFDHYHNIPRTKQHWITLYKQNVYKNRKMVADYTKTRNAKAAQDASNKQKAILEAEEKARNDREGDKRSDAQKRADSATRRDASAQSRNEVRKTEDAKNSAKGAKEPAGSKRARKST